MELNFHKITSLKKNHFIITTSNAQQLEAPIDNNEPYHMDEFQFMKFITWMNVCS